MNLRFHFQCKVTEGFLNMDKDILKIMIFRDKKYEYKQRQKNMSLAGKGK